jgi:hypothetical protein
MFPAGESFETFSFFCKRRILLSDANLGEKKNHYAEFSFPYDWAWSTLCHLSETLAKLLMHVLQGEKTPLPQLIKPSYAQFVRAHMDKLILPCFYHLLARPSM